MDTPTKGRKRYGSTARSSPIPGPDLDTTSAKRRLHEAVIVDADVEDWEEHVFGSSRVSTASYSPSRHQLIVEWANGYTPYVYDAVPPAVWSGFRSAGSAGQYVNHTLNQFPYRPYSGY
jgi:hypothetical protein